MSIPEPDIEHVWQAFRIRCLHLAIKARGPSRDPGVIDLAKKFEEYILTKSDIEKKQADVTTR